MAIPGMPEFNPMMLLHGEEQIEIHQPVLPDTTVLCQETVADLQDKKKATVLIIKTEGKDKESGELLFTLMTTLFIRGIGGFENKGSVGVKLDFPKPPKR